jgi:putative Ca2+/H+ antiporter (TMEM165/GDT1 family)
MLENSALLFSALITIIPAIFIAELTDKDALLLLTLSTRIKPRIVFFAGSVAFTITSAIIVTVGYFLVRVFPVPLITIAGGVIMIAYGAWGFFKTNKNENDELSTAEKKLSINHLKSTRVIFLSAVSFLVLLDLAGDATEILTIVFVARYQNPLLVFVGAVCALVAATALETLIGNRLSKLLTPERIRIFSFLVFLIIGTAAILTGILQL